MGVAEEETAAAAVIVDGEVIEEVFAEVIGVAASVEATVAVVVVEEEVHAEEVLVGNPEGAYLFFLVDVCAEKFLRIFSAPDQPSTIDARLEKNDQDALVQAFRGISLNPSELPLRPGWGTLGQPVSLRSNFFAVRVPRGPLCEYDVKIKPAVAIRRIKRRIFELLEQLPEYARYKGGVAHDFGQKLIASRRLPQPLAFDVPFYDEDEGGPREGGKTYNVEISFIQDIDLGQLMRYDSVITQKR